MISRRRFRTLPRVRCALAGSLLRAAPPIPGRLVETTSAQASVRLRDVVSNPEPAPHPGGGCLAEGDRVMAGANPVAVHFRWWVTGGDVEALVGWRTLTRAFNDDWWVSAFSLGIPVIRSVVMVRTALSCPPLGRCCCPRGCALNASETSPRCVHTDVAQTRAAGGEVKPGNWTHVWSGCEVTGTSGRWLSGWCWV